MTTNPGFYKFENDLLRYAATGVYTPNYTILAQDHATISYPVDGWFWFDSQADAEAFFEINGQSTAQWVAFGAVLLADPSVNQMLGAALSAAPAVAMSISVGLGKAADGDSRVFMMSWAGAHGLGLISPELIAHVQSLAAAYDLPAEFITGLAP